MKEKLPSPESAIDAGSNDAIAIFKAWFKKSKGDTTDQSAPGVYLYDHEFEYSDGNKPVVCFFPEKYPPKWNKYLLKHKQSDTLSFGQWYYNSDSGTTFFYHLGGKSDPLGKGKQKFKDSIVKPFKAFMTAEASKVPFDGTVVQDAPETVDEDGTTTPSIKAKVYAMDTFLIDTKNVFADCEAIKSQYSGFSSECEAFKETHESLFEKETGNLKKTSLEDSEMQQILSIEIKPEWYEFQPVFKETFDYALDVKKSIEALIKGFMAKDEYDYDEASTVSSEIDSAERDSKLSKFNELHALDEDALSEALTSNPSDKSLYEDAQVRKNATIVKNKKLIQDYVTLLNYCKDLDDYKAPVENTKRYFETMEQNLVVISAVDAAKSGQTPVSSDSFKNFSTKLKSFRGKGDDAKAVKTLEKARLARTSSQSKLDEIEKLMKEASFIL